MTLFKRKPKPTGPVMLWNKTFTQSKSFKGFRRQQLTTYKEPGVEDTLSAWAKKDYNFAGATIQLQCMQLESSQVINVYVDGQRIGCRYSSHAFYADLAGREYDAVHLRVDGDDVYLFVHYTD